MDAKPRWIDATSSDEELLAVAPGFPVFRIAS
jgi:hypothetical protein